MAVATGRRVAQDQDAALNEWMNDEVDRRVWYDGDESTPPGVYYADQVP